MDGPITLTKFKSNDYSSHYGLMVVELCMQLQQQRQFDESASFQVKLFQI